MRKNETSRFSRERLTEFVKDVSSEATRIEISISAEEDRAEIYFPFEEQPIEIKGGEELVFGKVIPGSMTERHFKTVRTTKKSERKKYNRKGGKRR